jgi:hypothetical protein
MATPDWPAVPGQAQRLADAIDTATLRLLQLSRDAAPPLAARDGDLVHTCELCLARERVAELLRRLRSRVSATNYQIVHDRRIGGELSGNRGLDWLV